MSGSGGGGGYQYQAQATAYVAAHILAKEPLHWIEHFISDIPVVIAAETGGPGDDIRIELQDGSVIELQTKHGLKKDEKFWESLVKLVHGLVEDSSLYGILLTDSTASLTIRGELREDLERLGQGRGDNLKAITQEVIDRLSREQISYSSDTFRRFRIVIADLDNSQRDAKTALVLLSRILNNPDQAGQTWKVLSDDGLDLITKRGQRDTEALLRLLGSNGLQLSPVINLEREINWHQICRAMLDRQIQFPTLNDLMAKDGVRVDPAKLFVPVGLVERKQKQHRRSDVGFAEQGSQLLQPIEEEIVQRFEHEEDFFSQVICNPEISSNSRLVITGEPGAGKTTLLQKIGDRLDQAGLFPVWVSLSKNGVPPTYEFLSHLLKENAQSQNVQSSDWDGNISALLQTGKVWLLLDGADELTTDGNPLQIIGTQLREPWASQVKVVLTCRLNAWDIYALPEFRVFRTLEFDYQAPVDGDQNQVEAYIQQFFAKEHVDPQLGDALIQQLHLSGKERIRDSVKNPLRLALLCYVWEAGIGELPDTKAELYRLFVDYYYDLQALKHPENNIDRTERDVLNLALGEVAKAALDSPDSRFRLRKSLIESIPRMGKPDTKGSLFAKAIQLGWLNSIGTTTEKPHEAAYAFFHSTFQEYFAALAIDDWDFFLPRNHKDKPIKGKKYRVFEPIWQEIILLWLGRSHLQVSKDQKDAFIKALIDFKDDCKELYLCRAYFLAAKYVVEFNACSHANEISSQIVRWAFGFLDREQQTWKIYDPCFSYQAHFLIQKLDQAQVKFELLKLLQESSKIREDILDPSQISVRETTAIKISLTILEIDSKNSEAINTITEVVNSSEAIIFQDFKGVEASKLVESIREDIFFKDFLEQDGRTKVENCNEDILADSEEIQDLIKSFSSTQFASPNYCRLFSDLERVVSKNPNAFSPIISIIEKALNLEPQVDNYVLMKAVGWLEKIGLTNSYVADLLMQLLLSSQDFGNCGIRHCALRSLIFVGYGNQKVFDFLIELVHERKGWAIQLNSLEPGARYTALGGLGGIANDQLFRLVALNLKAYLQGELHYVNRMFEKICYTVLFRCAQNMSYPDFYRAWHSSSSTVIELPVEK